MVRKKLFSVITPMPILQRLSITGTNKHKRKEYRIATEWMLASLIGSRLVRNIDLTIRFVPYLGNYTGDCEWIDDNVSPRQFLIRIANRVSSRQQLLTLAHELTHLKQFVTNQLFDYAKDPDLSRWHGKVVDASTIPYMKLPWERDAYGMQRIVMNEYLKWKKIQKK